MIDRIPWATWKPIGDPKDEPSILPTTLIFHTMVGSLRGTDSYFRSGNGKGFQGTESTFGVGGMCDGELDGAVWQWQSMLRQADAQFAGNAYADSVETSDGGNPNHPWSSKQLDSLIRLTVDWCKATGRPCELVPSESAARTKGGLGYHSLLKEWNKNGHVCPGQVRIGQLRTIVIPKARAVLLGGATPAKPSPAPAPHKPAPSAKLAVDGVFGPETIKALQHVIGVGVDGVFGPDTRVHLQLRLKVRPDGIIGPQTVKALQSRVGARPIDGKWGASTTKALQTALNNGRF